MPTTINEQNAKQIRQPMDVLITMQVPDDDITLSFSGYSSTSKAADGVLTEPTWPMRNLADLQGNGFALDGSRSLYEALTPSATNGKLGIRGDVGQAVNLTVTGSQTMAGLTVIVSGASSVTYNGYSYPVTAGRCSLLIGATTASLLFTPASEDTRIEISEVQTGTDITINNDNLISCTVSLRSDLSPFDQTLPESELNIEAYFDADVSDAVAMIPDDTPIYYSAGYEGDMSPVRSFYVSGQITWKDNVLSIHAVDAVHFLDDIKVDAPITQMDSGYFFNTVRYLLDRAGISPQVAYNTGWFSNARRWIIREGTTARKFIAFLNQCLNLTDENRCLYDGSGRLGDELKFTYTDAGIPRLLTSTFWRMDYTVKEEDCADIKKNIDRMPGTVTAGYHRIINPTLSYTDGDAQKVGSATFIKNVGTSISFEKYAYFWLIGLYLGDALDNEIEKKLYEKYGTIWGTYKTMPVVPCRSDGWYYGEVRNISYPAYVGDKIITGDIPQSEFKNYKPNASDKTVYSSFVPWSQSYSGWRYDNNSSHLIRTSQQMWDVLSAAGVLASDTQTVDLDIYGCAFNLESATYTNTINDKGSVYTYDELPVIGRVAAKLESNAYVEIFPAKMLSVGMYRSPVTGSFTWKGDPRMQPRDIIYFKRLDGSYETITIETITLKHENGGTNAEITYRKGVI